MAIVHKIYPPIGVARLGRSPEAFYIGPEGPGLLGVDIDAAGNETAIIEFKDAQHRHKRQAARFRIFEFRDGDTVGTPLELPAGAKIEWTVELANIKDGITRSSSPPRGPTRPVRDPAGVDRSITPASRSISGAGSSGQRFDTGDYLGTSVSLGEIRTDVNQNLLVIGAHGHSDSPINPPAPLTNFYTNPGWYDDVSDGPVTAKLTLPGGEVIENIAPAWVVVAPPAFAPEISGVVTLHDIIRQVGIDHFGVPDAGNPSFTHDIYPIIRRASLLQWVHDDSSNQNRSDEGWAAISTDWQELAKTDAAAETLRTTTADLVDDAERFLIAFMLTKRQKEALAAWVGGAFENDWAGVPAPAAGLTAEGLLRAALESCVGQGFFPGIEAGIILKDPTIYSEPFDFRLDHNVVQAGDITALMAQPWQADFLACKGNWWPTQRPDKARTSAAGPGSMRWARGIGGYHDMIADFWRLGVIQSAIDPNGEEVFVEQGRDPQLPNTPNDN